MSARADREEATPFVNVSRPLFTEDAPTFSVSQSKKKKNFTIKFRNIMKKKVGGIICFGWFLNTKRQFSDVQ